MENIFLEQVKDLRIFFGKNIPEHLSNYFTIPFIGITEEGIVKVIDFHKPFLRIEKLAIFKEEFERGKNYRSLGMGFIYPTDTQGHYNSTIYLAMCGWLMASSASVHLAYNFPTTAPQVVEADKVRPLKSVEGEGILKPKKGGTTFWVETIVRRSKLKFVLVTTNISFGNFAYGTIESLKFILASKESVLQAREVEEA